MGGHCSKCWIAATKAKGKSSGKESTTTVAVTESTKDDEIIATPTEVCQTVPSSVAPPAPAVASTNTTATAAEAEVAAAVAVTTTAPLSKNTDGKKKKKKKKAGYKNLMASMMAGNTTDEKKKDKDENDGEMAKEKEAKLGLGGGTFSKVDKI